MPQRLQLVESLQAWRALLKVLPVGRCWKPIAASYSMLHVCRKESRAAATKADEASLKLQRAQGENEVALQAGRNLDEQNAALKVSSTHSPYNRQLKWGAPNSVSSQGSSAVIKTVSKDPRGSSEIGESLVRGSIECFSSAAFDW